MNKKKIAVIAICAVLLFAAVFFAYDYLSKEYQPPAEELSGTPSEGSSDEEDSSEQSSEEVIMAPDFTVYDVEGNAVSLSDFAGKPVVINFWATWCGYCVKEMPAFEKAFAEYGDDVVFMMINVTDGQQETKEEAMEYVEENGYTFPVYYDTSLSATMAYGAWSLPATGFVTESGVFAGGQVGAMSEETLFDLIEQLEALE